jgi:hypothetical protein
VWLLYSALYVTLPSHRLKKTELDTVRTLPACPFFFPIGPRQANAGNGSPVRGLEARRRTCTARRGTRRSGTCPGTRCSPSRPMGHTAPPARSPRTTRSTGSRSPPTPTAPQEKPLQRKKTRTGVRCLRASSVHPRGLTSEHGHEEDVRRRRSVRPSHSSLCLYCLL